MSRLTLAQKAAGLIMIDVPGTEITEKTAEYMKKNAWAGVILFAKNVADRLQTQKFINDLHSNSQAPLLMAVDQEGGIVERFRFPEMSLSPGLMALGHANDLELTYKVHEVMGLELKDIGIHIDFAPCIDVNNNPANPIIGVRSFGSDPNLVAEHGAAALRGLQAGGVAACVKHFPGHGNTALDSHLSLPSISSTIDELRKTELPPFEAAIKAGVETIMTAHIIFPELDPELPATLSKPILTGILRKELGFNGIIVTDSLSMKAIADRWGFAEATVLSIEAGADLVLALGPVKNQLEALEGLIKAVEEGRITEARLDESLTKLEALRQKYNNMPCKPSWNIAEHRQIMQKAASNGIQIIKNERNLLPISAGSSTKIAVVSPDLLPQSPLGELSETKSLATEIAKFGILTEDIRFNQSIGWPAIPEIARRAAANDYVILALYARAGLTDSQIELAQEIYSRTDKVILLALANPFITNSIPMAHTIITGFNYGELTIEALAAKLLGK